VVLLPRQNFRRYLLGGPCLSREDVGSHVEVLGEAEVYQLDLPAVLLDGHEVLGLQVSVDNVALVALVERPHNVVEHLLAHLLVQLALLHNPVKEFPSPEHFHDELEALGVFLPFEQLHNVGVVQTLEDFQLHLQPGDIFYSTFGDDLAGPFFFLVRFQYGFHDTPLCALTQYFIT